MKSELKSTVISVVQVPLLGETPKNMEISLVLFFINYFYLLLFNYCSLEHERLEQDLDKVQQVQ